MPKGECIDIVATKADPTRNFYRVRFRNPKRFRDGEYTTPKWATRAAQTIGTKYYGVSGCKITMAKPKDGSWMIQSVLIPKGEKVDEKMALKIANHIQDRIEKEGQWAKKMCRDNETQRFVGANKRKQHIIRDSRGRFAPHAAEGVQEPPIRIPTGWKFHPSCYPTHNFRFESIDFVNYDRNDVNGLHPHDTVRVNMSCLNCGLEVAGQVGFQRDYFGGMVQDRTPERDDFSLEDGQEIPSLTLDEWTAVSKALGEVGTFHDWVHEGTDGEGGGGTTLVVNKKNGVFGRNEEYECRSCGEMRHHSLFEGFNKHRPLGWCEFCEDEYLERQESMYGAEDLKMESYCRRCDTRTKLSKYPQGANFCVCGRGKSIIVDGYELGSANETPQHIKDFLRSKGKRDYGAEGDDVHPEGKEEILRRLKGEIRDLRKQQMRLIDVWDDSNVPQMWNYTQHEERSIEPFSQEKLRRMHRFYDDENSRLINMRRHIRDLSDYHYWIDEFYGTRENFEAKGIDTFTDPFNELKGNGLRKTAMTVGSVVIGFLLGKRYGGDV